MGQFFFSFLLIALSQYVWRFTIFNLLPIVPKSHSFYCWYFTAKPEPISAHEAIKPALAEKTSDQTK